MSVASLISDDRSLVRADPSPWRDWALSTADLGYTATGSWASLQRGPGYQRWFGGAVLAALASAGVTGAAVYDLLVGTGGSAEYLIDQGPSDTTSAEPWHEVLAEIEGRLSAAQPPSTETAEVLFGTDLVAEIKATLGIGVTDLAMIAKVSRQTIYDWIGGGQVSQTNYGRLHALRQVCMDWQALTQKPVGRLLHVKNAEGASLFDLLGQGALDRAAIGVQLKALAIKAAQREDQRRQRRSKLAPLSEKDRYENALTHVSPATDS